MTNLPTRVVDFQFVPGVRDEDDEAVGWLRRTGELAEMLPADVSSAPG